MANENTTRLTHTTRWIAAAALALVAIDLFVFARVVAHDFITLDDSQYVTNNPVVQHGLTWAGIAWAFTTGHAANWHPLTWLSHMLDVELFGMDAAGPHAVNLLLHISGTLILFFALLRMTGAIGRSLVVAALFGAHPLHVESVAWVAERKDVLDTCFWWLTVWTYVSYVRQPTARRYCWLVASFTAGLLAKPMLVTMPFALLLLDVWPLGRLADIRSSRAWAPLVREKWALFALAGVSIVATLVAQGQGGAVVALQQLPFYARAENALVSYVAYLGKAVWPASLSLDHQFPSSIRFELATGACALLLGLSLIVLRLARRYPYLGVGWLWYLGTLVPVIGLVQVGSQAMADRYTYVPLVGIFIAIAWGVPDLVARWRVASSRLALPAAATIVVLLLAGAARTQVGYWANDLSLWRHAVVVEPENAVAHANLGGILSRRQQWDEALAEFSVAMRLNPELKQVRESIAVARHERGVGLFNARQMDTAIAEFSEALRLDPGMASAWNNRGLALATIGRINDALSDFTEAVRLQPDLEVAHLDLGLALRQVGRIEDARREFGQVLRLNPRNDGARRALHEIGGPPE